VKTTQAHYEAIIKIRTLDPPETQKRHIIEGLSWACVLLHDEYGLSADEIAGVLERVTDDIYDDAARR
jgi:hypothetical protein